MKVLEILKEFFKNHTDVLMQFAVHTVILWLILKFIDQLSKKIKLQIQKQPDNTTMLHLLLALTKIVKIVAILLIVTSFLQSNGYTLTSLMTGLGITGLAIGLAAQETLSSVFGSISIMSDKVYKLGDYIYVNGVEGTVEAINFHSTKIRTTDNVLVTIPNNIPADNIVKTRTAKCKRVINEFFDIEYGTSDENIQKAKNILKNICEQHDKIDNNCNVFISKLGENAISIQLYTNTKTTQWTDYMIVRDELFAEVIKQYRENNINFAFPSKTVYLRNDDEN